MSKTCRRQARRGHSSPSGSGRVAGSRASLDGHGLGMSESTGPQTGWQCGCPAETIAGRADEGHMPCLTLL